MSSVLRRLYVGLFAILVLGFCISPVCFGQTYVNRVWHYPPGQDPYYTIEDITYSTDIVWDAAGAPYVCEAHVTVDAAALLSVEDGVVVEVLDEKGIFVNGNLAAHGATFTVYGTGYWRGIYLSPASNSSSLVGCTLRFAGGVGYCYYGCSGLGRYHDAARFTSLYIDDCSPTISGCHIEESWSNGVEIWRGGATLQGNQFHNLGADSYSIVYDITDTYPVLAGNIGSGTGYAGVSVPGGRWLSSGTWHKGGDSFPYYLRTSLVVETGATLSLQPGVSVLSEGNIGLYVRGTLSAGGTSDSPVIFSSRKAEPSKGDWNGIYLGPGAGNSELNYCSVRYAGGIGYCYYGCRGLGFYHGADRFAAVYVDESSPILDTCTIADSYTNGIETFGGVPAILSCSIQSSRQNGLRMEGDSHPVLGGCGFLSNGSEGYYAVTQDASSTADPTDVTFADNRYQGIEVRGGHLSQSAVWHRWAPNAPYVVTAMTTVDHSGSLALESGTVVKVGGETIGLILNGVVIAEGTPETIVFTSLHDDSIAGDTNDNDDTSLPDRGDWLGIYMGPGADGSRLYRCSILYSGSYGYCYYGCHGHGNIHGADRFAALYIDEASPEVVDCTIENSLTNGIEIWRGGPSLILSRFHNMGNDGYPLVYSTTDTYPRMAGNITSGTGHHGIYVPAGRMHAAGCWEKAGGSFPYVVQGDVTVSAGTVLSISPGVVLKMVGGAGLYVHGTLIANGTPLEQITFTSANPAPVQGEWPGIYFGPESGDSILHFCSILYGGSYGAWGGVWGLGDYHGATRYTSVYIDASSPLLGCCTIAKAFGSGVELYSSAATIANTVLYDCGGRLIRLDAGSAPTIVNNSLVHNTRGEGVGIDCYDSSPTLTNNIIAFNTTGIKQTGSGSIGLTKNCVFGNGTNYSGLSAGASDLSQDPQLTGSSEGDCHLGYLSPCIDAAQDMVAPPIIEDRDGALRPVGGLLDIGAYEYGAPKTDAMALSAIWCVKDWYGLFDLNLDQEVNAEDLILLMRRWR